MTQDMYNNRCREGKTVVYTTCRCNCGSTSQCVFKAHVKDGVVIAVEPDDRYNTGVGREDAVLSEEDLLKVRLQRRPCTKGLVFHKHLYHPERILYPLKIAPNTKRGEGKYVRISWDEALDTIADKMRESREKYGPYSVIVPFYSPGNSGLARLFTLWGAGAEGWGWSSYDTIRMMSHIMAGAPGWEFPNYCSSSAANMLAHAKLGLRPDNGFLRPGPSICLVCQTGP
jgi:anaerobic selenocysteine-containing dehydrogenase